MPPEPKSRRARAVLRWARRAAAVLAVLLVAAMPVAFLPLAAVIRWPRRRESTISQTVARPGVRKR